ncbi:MAG TPA: UDP-galactopyranose mutase [Acidimicrobiales bacterium]|nr:UDP-galactopyranose mutase [Acidimicrobiales bacterium]
MSHIAIAGAGFSGAVVARELAEAGCAVEVFEGRSHVAGNCHTERHATGVMLHVYGPHIFHTQSDRVWDYVNRFTRMHPYTHRVRAVAQGRVYSLPVNLLTINQFFGTTLSPREAETFVAERSDTSIENPVSFEDQGLRFVGKELYEAFFAGYTKKQWGLDPSELPASILKRLPVRFSYEDSYFSHPYQAIPESGYTALVENILDHPAITVHVDRPLRQRELEAFDHSFWTGPIDGFFEHEHGRLAYRTLDFEQEVHDGDFQGCPVMNYCDEEVPFTRITEFKHFTPWEDHAQTVIYREFSRACGDADIPYYPIRQVREKEQLLAYVKLAREVRGTTFLGRLGTYRYLDMDVAIGEALAVAEAFLAARGAGRTLAAFVTDPLGAAS